MGVINRVAQGFLDLVDAQTQGKSPPAFVDAVAPVVDLNEYYVADALGYFELNPNHSAAGSVSSMVVGDDEIWRVRGLAVVMPNANTTFAEQWGVRLSRAPRVPANAAIPDPSPFIWMTGVDLMNTTTNGRDVVRAIQFALPLLLQPGNALLFDLLQRDGGGARISQCQAVLDVLRR